MEEFKNKISFFRGDSLRFIFFWTTIFTILFATVLANAATQHISYSLADIQIESNREAGGFSSLHIPNLSLSRNVGQPELPVHSALLVGTPETIQVDIKVLASERMNDLKPMPVQKQICRCEADSQRQFSFDAQAYESEQPTHTLTYLGAFRGTPITRLDVNLAKYDAASNSVEFLNNIQINHDAAAYSSSTSRETYNDYLIITPDNLAAGVQDFATWKRSLGYKVTIETLHTPELTIKAVTDLVAKGYKDKGIDFVIIIGDEKTIPMNVVQTSGGKTNSDLNYFVMDGVKDTVPDMFYGRIALGTAAEVNATLAKAIAWDKKTYKNSSGLLNVIGIASNEGSTPSDNEYIQSIESKFVSSLGFTAKHFYQSDKNSNSTELNKVLTNGASWMFYVGHGSGDSWPSMNREYVLADVSNISNKDSVKPILIDVACQNGRLLPGYLGTSFSSVLSTSASGAAAYYGGTVNISWDPPAIMARGIAYEQADKNFRHLGEALFAGQMYLAANWSGQGEVVDNFEWYHLQGDPGMLIAH
jgi:hypothetical protein